VILDFTDLGRHLIMDGVGTSVYINSIMSRVAAVPRFGAKKAEDMKFKFDLISAHIGAAAHCGRHIFVPSAIEDGGRIGAHGRAALMMPA